MQSHRQRFMSLLVRSISAANFSPSVISSPLFASFSSVAPVQCSSSSAIYVNDSTKINSNFNESEALQELSALMPIHYFPPTINSFCVPNVPQKHGSVHIMNQFLPLEDKLRGVFLQKLNGKAAIEDALTACVLDTEEPLTVDVVANVVDNGNLSGEAMVVFFNWAMKQPGRDSDLSAYHMILKALGRRKFFKPLMDMLQGMCKNGTFPTTEMLAIVADSFVRAGLVSRGIAMLDEWEHMGVKCDASVLNVVLESLCRRGHVGRACSVFNSKRGKMQLDRMTYNVVLGGWSKLGRESEMEKTLEAMVDDGFDADCSTYACLIEGLGRSGRLDDAVQIFKSMEDEGCVPDTSVYNAMVGNYVSVGDLDECMKYYQQMWSSNCLPNMDTYVKIIQGLVKARKVSDAIEMFDDMLRRGIIPSAGDVTSFIEPLCSFGPPHAAMAMYRSAKRNGCRISMSAYKLLLMRLSRFGKCGMILKLWEEMQENGYNSDVEVYEYVVNGLCNNGQLESAVLVVEESLRRGFCPSRLICSKLNNKLLASDDARKAYRLFLKIKAARRLENARTYWRANGWHF